MHRMPYGVVASREGDLTDRRGTPWISLLLGAALLAAVVGSVLHFSEERAFIRVAQQARPAWLVVAAVLQAATYLVQGDIWRRVGAAGEFHLSRRTAFELLAACAPGATVVSAGIHMSDIPAFPYCLLWQERTLRSVANLTRQDAIDFMAIAARVPLRIEVKSYALADANAALDDLRAGRISGAAARIPRGLPTI